MSDERLMSRDELEFTAAARRNLLTQRANEMKRLLTEIIALIDSGEYETDYAGKLLENVNSHKMSRERIIDGIKRLEGNG